MLTFLFSSTITKVPVRQNGYSGEWITDVMIYWRKMEYLRRVLASANYVGLIEAQKLLMADDVIAALKEDESSN